MNKGVDSMTLKEGILNFTESIDSIPYFKELPEGYSDSTALLKFHPQNIAFETLGDFKILVISNKDTLAYKSSIENQDDFIFLEVPLSNDNVFVDAQISSEHYLLSVRDSILMMKGKVRIFASELEPIDTSIYITESLSLYYKWVKMQHEKIKDYPNID